MKLGLFVNITCFCYLFSAIELHLLNSFFPYALFPNLASMNIFAAYSTAIACFAYFLFGLKDEVLKP
jgi:hypothetical protein